MNDSTFFCGIGGSGMLPLACIVRASGGRVAGSDRAVDVQMARLRRKIEDDPRQPRYLLTARGSGYVLRPGS